MMFLGLKTHFQKKVLDFYNNKWYNYFMEKIKNFLIRLWLFNRNFEFKRLSKWLKVALDKRMDRWNSMSDIEKKAWLDSSSDKFISFAWNLYILLKDFFYVYDLRKR